MGFDLSTFLKTGGSASDLASQFGVPSCMLTLGTDILSVIPVPILQKYREAVVRGRQRADTVVKNVNAEIRDALGISLFPDRDGNFGFFSRSSRFGLEVLNITEDLGEFIGAAQGVVAAGGELARRFEAAAECMSKFKEFLDFLDGNSFQRREELGDLEPTDLADIVNGEFGALMDLAGTSTTFVDLADTQIGIIDDIILDSIVNPPAPPPPEITESVFRLEAGPPRSKTGKFLLSVDGLYYDSQTSGVQPALLELEDRSESVLFEDGGFPFGEAWKLEFDPSLGGRGLPTTSKDLRYYFNSVLDPDIIDNSPSITAYYDQDDLLLSIRGQKDRRVFDVSSEIKELVEDSASQAIIENMRQVLFSEIAQFDDKLNKRKKQVELAVKVPTFLGKGPLFTPGNIPVNDFSYLAGSNFLLDIQNQRKIVIQQDDVTGVVLPLETKFTEKIETTEEVVIDHILLSNIARGETISNPLEPSAPSLQINDRIISDGLIALYNYLTVKEDVASGTNFSVRNSSDFGRLLDSQLVGSSPEVFTRGLGIPFLSGVAFPKDGSSEIDVTGSYLRLPDRPQFQDLLYNSGGATFETWIHMPDLDGTTQGYNLHDNNTLGLYRLILANENVGISDSKQPQEDINNMSPDAGTGIVRGAILGFTRDRRFTLGLEPSNDSSDNPVGDLCLVLAPTQSYDSSSAGFIADKTNCNKTGIHGMTIPVFETFNGVSLSSCGRSFTQLSVCMDPPRDEVRVYLDGVKLMTSSYQGTFGTQKLGEAYKSPSIYQNNSFEYSGGPSLDNYFTPWILGGGYTDGLSSGNFMGGEFGGKISGLRGHLGCTRFYSKPLEDSEVLNNYKATKNFFKNIEVPNSMWEPINIV
tara:strand:- start:20933 stop:23530 length:2598 start_codon:yes stop_codon:yes gene_type:complete